MKELHEALSATSYPGRGILLGRSACGSYAYMAYFIMGRSENSRNRVFVAEGEGLRTKAFDEARMKDPSLVIYWPLRVEGSTTIVTNGDQTDTIAQGLKKGLSFEEALRSREFEPDAPNFTPRISGYAGLAGGKLSFGLSILKTDDGGRSCARYFYRYDDPQPGEGRLIHTYRGDGEPLPSFAGEPAKIRLGMDFSAFAKTAWSSLNDENKVSLLARRIDIATGKYEQIIFNKNH
ncbi:MAG: IMP cyclohydrolase [Christensenellaceae bacterium]|jgi:IMP cyclohydrolase|nr:IMP cyclohydrolase [Christensenellaceae bacterium]